MRSTSRLTAVMRVAADEHEELRKEARKNAVEKRKQKVSDAADAF